MLGPTPEEIDLRNTAVKSLREYIRKLKIIENELADAKPVITTPKKKTLPAMQQSQVSKTELLKQLKTELENLLGASENVQNRFSGETISEKMYDSLARFLDQEKKSVQLFSNGNSEFVKFINEIQLYMKCQSCHALLRNYANDRFGNAHKYFKDIIEKQKNLPKNKDKPSKALEIRTKTGDFLALFYPSPVQPRDQLVVDTFREYSESEENKKTELYAIGAMMADMSTFQITLERIARVKKEFKDDINSLEMALDAFLENDLGRKYNAIMDKKEGLIQKIKDPVVRKKIAVALTDIMKAIDADLPEEYKRRKIVAAATVKKTS